MARVPPRRSARDRARLASQGEDGLLAMAVSMPKGRRAAAAPREGRARYCPKTSPMLRPRGGSTATVRPTARGSERGCLGKGVPGALSTHCRVPDGSARHDSAPRTRRGRGAGDALRRGSDGQDTPPGSSARSVQRRRWHLGPERASARSARPRLGAHWGAIAGADFFTSAVWTPRGLVTYYTLFVIDLQSRRVHVTGSTPTPDAGFMAQAARRLTDAVDGFLAGHRVLICDRDRKWTEEFRRIVQTSARRTAG